MPYDPTSSKCYHIQLPNVSEKDKRLRLDVRSGSTSAIYKSRIVVYGGSTVPLSLSPTFTLSEVATKFQEFVDSSNPEQREVDYNDYLSGECFSLNLIERHWDHLAVKGDEAQKNRPPARMFHSMMVHDNYVFVHGGIRFGPENKLVVLNDFWRFDMLDKTWRCILADGASNSLRRFNHKSVMLSTLAIVKRPMHHGIFISGGINESGSIKHDVEIYDLISETYHCELGVMLKEKILDTESGQSHYEYLKVRTSMCDTVIADNLSDVPAETNSLFKPIFCYSPVDRTRNEQPLVEFHGIEVGVGQRRKITNCVNSSIREHKNIPFGLRHPTIGSFGENIIVTGFMPNDLNISLFVYNRNAMSWTRLQIYCTHSTWSHRFCRGYVWNSHHKVIFLGNRETSTTLPSVQFFNIFVAVSLPFTNAFGLELGEVNKVKAAAATPEAVPIATPTAPPLSTSPATSGHFGSISSFSSDHSGHSQKESSSFAEYSHYIAPQINVNSIRSVFPSYAVALGKHAFERSYALSDFELVCADGTTIPMPVNLCRKRWGRRFDIWLAKAYARAYADIHNPNRGTQNDSEDRTPGLHVVQNSAGMRSNHSLSRVASATESFNSVKLTLSRGSKEDRNAAPTFRYPFQDKDHTSSSRLGSPGLPSSRRGSANLVAPNPMSRRSSSNNQPTSRKNSLGVPRDYLNMSQSRRNSSTLNQSRRNSANNYAPPSRRGSALGRGSIVSTSSTSSSSSSQSYGLPLDQTARNPFLSTSVPQIPASPHVLDESILKNLPPQPPMPEIDSSKMTPATSGATSRLAHSVSFFSDSSGSNPSMPPSSDSHTSSFDRMSTASPRRAEASSPPNEEDAVKFPADEDAVIDVRFLPRSLYLPFSNATVRAFSEFLYTGQVGSNWKVVPTALEVLMVAKFYEVPLLYDLILEVLYVIIGRKEVQLVSDAKQLRAELQSNDIQILKTTDFNDGVSGVTAIDQFSNYLMRLDDGLMDLTLLKRASKAAGRYSHSEGSTTPVSASVYDQNMRRKSLGNNTRLRAAVAAGAPSTAPASPGEIQSDGSGAHTPRRRSVPSVSRQQSFENNEKGKRKLVEEITSNNSSTSESMNETIGMIEDVGYESEHKKPEKPEKQHQSTSQANAKDSKEWPTFKTLMAPNAPACSDVIIDLIVEVAALASDLKLMLRGINAREMSVQLKRERQELENIKSRRKKEAAAAAAAASVPVTATATAAATARTPPNPASRSSSQTNVNDSAVYATPLGTPSATGSSLAFTKLDRTQSSSSSQGLQRTDSVTSSVMSGLKDGRDSPSGSINGKKKGFASFFKRK